MDIAVVGAGRVGTAMAVLLERAGHRIVGLAGASKATAERAARFLPDVRVRGPSETASAGELVLLGTPDDVIAATCEALAREGAFRDGQNVAHLSGATSIEALAPARGAGARVLCLHPLQTLPTVEAAIDRIPGSTFAVTADDEDGFALGERLATDAGGRPFRLADDAKPLYHAAAVFASNYLFVLTSIAEELLGEVGVEEPLDALAPLQHASLDNAFSMGPGAALTGPAVRGDAGTIRRHLEVLSERAPGGVAAYVAMARAALDLGERFGRLSGERRGAVEEVLSKWT